LGELKERPTSGGDILCTARHFLPPEIAAAAAGRMGDRSHYGSPPPHTPCASGNLPPAPGRTTASPGHRAHKNLVPRPWAHIKPPPGSFEDYGGPYGTGDVITCCLDADAGTLGFCKNGEQLGVAFELPKHVKGQVGWGG
jgi:hypothetical protein